MRVLLVEDEPLLAKTIERGLTLEGFVVSSVHTGPEGLAVASTEDFDVIVLDIMLPGLSGYEVVRTLRARERWTPVLMLTAKDGEYDQADALDLGADDYLTKPFSFVVLVARLRALIRRGAPQRPTLLTVDDLVLDPSGHTVRRGDATVDLTPREFNLLHYLMRNAGAVVTKHAILSNVWDTDYDSGENAVEVYVSYLRKKIDAPFGTSSIDTVRGVGYRMKRHS
ncbi:response regulator [Gordonia humi]|uniref:Two-component system OmpR family response regulator n=1 Tax=Gordonia humi TaxID=686429 RepID=A0A840EXK9_9ACTN|nr:two-component system OmpR family response regulator [Gordonia humi]